MRSGSLREAHVQKLESEAHLIRYAKAQIILRDYWLTALKETEYRVIEFVLRQTLGFNKNEDIISIDQFIHGIGDRSGVGVSRSNVIAAVHTLGEIGLLLESHRYYDDSEGRKPSSFRINLDMLFDTPPSRELLERPCEGREEPAARTWSCQQDPHTKNHRFFSYHRAVRAVPHSNVAAGGERRDLLRVLQLRTARI